MKGSAFARSDSVCGGRRKEEGGRREDGVHVCDGSANNDLYVNNAHRLFDEVVPEAFVINLMGGL